MAVPWVCESLVGWRGGPESVCCVWAPTLQCHGSPYRIISPGMMPVACLWTARFGINVTPLRCALTSLSPPPPSIPPPKNMVQHIVFVNEPHWVYSSEVCLMHSSFLTELIFLVGIMHHDELNVLILKFHPRFHSFFFEVC